MAKTSSVARNEKRKALVKKYFELRKEVKKKLLDANLTESEYFELQKKFSKLPRNSSPVRVRNRCAVSGRSRGVSRMFGVSRLELREMASNGEVPGMVKSSW